MFIANVAMLLDVETEAQALDAVNQILNEQLASFSPASSLIDFAQTNPVKTRDYPEDYNEGDFISYPEAQASALGDAEIAILNIEDDYMVNENRHPGYVLIPVRKFDEIRHANRRVWQRHLKRSEGA